MCYGLHPLGHALTAGRLAAARGVCGRVWRRLVTSAGGRLASGGVFGGAFAMVAAVAEVGDGDGVEGGAQASLEVAFQAVAHSLERLQAGVREVKYKADRTGDTVRDVSECVNDQAMLLQRLQRRLLTLKGAGARAPPATPTPTPAATARALARPPSPSRPRRLAVHRGGQLLSTPPSASPRGRSARRRAALGDELLRAAEDGREGDVRRLLAAGADPDHASAGGWTALHRAARESHADVIAQLLLSGANVNARTHYGFTALHMAAYHDLSARCVTLLLDAGSNLGSRNETGRTPLHSAAESGNAEAVQELLAAGASRFAKNNVGKTPYDVAKNTAIRRLLRSEL